MWCGNYCIVMECRLNDCAQRKRDGAFGVDVKNQVCKFLGLQAEGHIKVLQRDGDKLELEYTMNCRQCSLPIAYRHQKNIKQCERIFVLQDAISNDQTCAQQKIQEFK